MSNSPTIHWKDAPDDHDYPAAGSYLSLIFPKKTVKRLIKSLRHAESTSFAAKDLLRAAGTSALPQTNPHVAHDLAKIADGHPLSPVLLVRGHPLIVADGYHRISAVYSIDENVMIPCRIIDLTP